MNKNKSKQEQETQEKEDLESIMDNVDMSEKSELQGVAHEIFLNTPSRSNITHFEASACFVSNVIFPTLGMAEENPVNFFLELKKSQNGWSTDKFVHAASGIQDIRSGGSIMMGMKEKLFGKKE